MDLESMRVETDLFEHREVKPHFINRAARGGFARWLRQQLGERVPPATSSEPIQEDYGCGFWATRGPDPCWIALSFVIWCRRVALITSQSCDGSL
jgi:hypothetical protein